MRKLEINSRLFLLGMDTYPGSSLAPHWQSDHSQITVRSTVRSQSDHSPIICFTTILHYSPKKNLEIWKILFFCENLKLLVKHMIGLWSDCDLTVDRTVIWLWSDCCMDFMHKQVHFRKAFEHKCDTTFSTILGSTCKCLLWVLLAFQRLSESIPGRKNREF